MASAAVRPKQPLFSSSVDEEDGDQIRPPRPRFSLGGQVSSHNRAASTSSLHRSQEEEDIQEEEEEELASWRRRIKQRQRPIFQAR